MDTLHTALEIVHCWDDTALDTTLLREPTEITLGGDEATFLVPGITPRTLVTHEDGGWVLHAQPDAEVLAADESGRLELEGRTVLTAGMRVEVRLGEFRFHLRPTEPVEQTPRAPITVDRGLARCLGAAALFAAAFLGLTLLSPPSASALSNNLDQNQVSYIRAQLDAVARDTPEPAPASSSSEGNGTGMPSESSPAGGDGEPGEGTENATRATRRGTPGPRQVTAQDVSELGTFQTFASLTGGLGDGGSPYGDDRDVGMSWQDFGGTPGGNGIFGGLDMNDTGRGTCSGEHCGDGVARVGDDLLGDHDMPTGGEPGPLTRRNDDRIPPGFRPGPVTTTGGLTRSQVRREVNRHRNEITFCYEQALVSRPDLEGRVTVRFTVLPTGAVQTAVASDTMSGGRVGSCVSDSVQRWTFPQTAGVTNVNYPFLFHSAR